MFRGGFRYFFVFLFLVTLASSCDLDLQGQNINDVSRVETQPQDLVYYVEAPYESLAEIVTRFTADTNNIDPVARINAVDPNALLKRGQLIRIPHYMLKK
ncbi:MAG: hypothetical protein LBE20_03430 [Deltaproteobacteria bacterium]|jgi:hypothetical protein|nr:hypothetical protein [Deltaproteobacteria bacterium]